MASWVTHLWIADSVMKEFPKLNRRGFCVGNIAPDCNVENEDWTSFTPSRELTHWMSGDRKAAVDGDVFCEKYILKSEIEKDFKERHSFLLGYYAHLITDAAFQEFIRNEKRVRDVWDRIKGNAELKVRATGYAQTWDSVKQLIAKDTRMREIYTIEAEYLRRNPDSGYLTEIMVLEEFPDYIDYLPHGCIVRKIGVMGYIPKQNENFTDLISISLEEYNTFVNDTVALVRAKLHLLDDVS